MGDPVATRKNNCSRGENYISTPIEDVRRTQNGRAAFKAPTKELSEKLSSLILSEGCKNKGAKAPLLTNKNCY